MKFECCYKKEKWYGEISSLKKYGSHIEIFIKSRSSIMLLFGKTSRGYFASCPDFDAGCHLIDLKNKFWNEENLVRVLGRVDGITAATALYEISKSKIEY